MVVTGDAADAAEAEGVVDGDAVASKKRGRSFRLCVCVCLCGKANDMRNETDERTISNDDGNWYGGMGVKRGAKATEGFCDSDGCTTMRLLCISLLSTRRWMEGTLHARFDSRRRRATATMSFTQYRDDRCPPLLHTRHPSMISLSPWILESGPGKTS